MNYKEKILELSKLRYEIILNEAVGFNNPENEKKIDEYADQIADLLKKGFDNLEFEFIVEQLSHLGDSPNLLYDDNGMWIVSCDGYQSVVTESPVDKFETCFLIENKNAWANNPREALRYYLFNEDDE